MRRLWLACVAAGVNGMTSAPTVSCGDELVPVNAAESTPTKKHSIRADLPTAATTSKTRAPPSRRSARPVPTRPARARRAVCLLSKVAAVQVILTFFGATVLQAKENSKDSEAGDPNGVYAGPVFAGVCVSVGLVTLVFALYLFLSEMKTYASKTRVGRQLSGAANFAKKRIRRIGSSEIGAEEEAKDDAAAAAL